jgi:ribonuclease HI
MLTLCFDGLFRSVAAHLTQQTHAGFMCYGWIITRQGLRIAHGHGAFAHSKNASSNIAEYLALIEGLDALLDLGIENELVEVCGDAKSVIDQMCGKALVNAASIKPLYRRAMQLASRLPNIQWSWTPRKHNRPADSLSRRALRQMRLNHGSYQAALEMIINDTSWSDRLLPVMDLRLYNAGRMLN